MASLRTRQRRDGTVYTSVLYVHEGKQTSSSFNNHAEALRFQDVCNRLGPAEALHIWRAAKPQEGHTVTSLIVEHIDALSGVEKKTVAEYRRYLTRDIEPTLGHIPLSTLSSTDIGRWVNKMRDAGASGKTVQNKVGFLSGVLSAAVRQGLMSANPTTGVRLPRTVAREMAFLTPEECARWLADNEASAFGRETASYEAWLATCKQGHAVGLIMGPWGIKTGVELNGEIYGPS